MKDYRLEIRIRNNRLLGRIEAAGYVSVKQFSDAFALSYTCVAELVRMEKAAKLRTGAWTPLVEGIAAALACNPEDLFNERQAAAAVKTGKIVREVDEPLPLALPDDALGPEKALEYRDLVRHGMEELSPRLRHIVARYYGLDGEPGASVAEIADEIGVSRGRAGQLVDTALVRMRSRLRNRYGVRGLDREEKEEWPAPKAKERYVDGVRVPDGVDPVIYAKAGGDE
jgi:hypothetical protein